MKKRIQGWDATILLGPAQFLTRKMMPTFRVYYCNYVILYITLNSRGCPLITFSDPFKLKHQRFSLGLRFMMDEGKAHAEYLKSHSDTNDEDLTNNVTLRDDESGIEEDYRSGEEYPEVTDGMDPEGFSGPSMIVKPLTPEALAAFKAAQERAGVIYISRLPPGMRPSKVRHIMSAYGGVGRVYLQQEGTLILLYESWLQFHLVHIDAKRAYLRRKYTTSKKPHFTEGWVEFKDKKVARSVAEMLNAQSIGGRKGTRWRDDVWTMKYLPKFKWNALTEQVGENLFQYTEKSTKILNTPCSS